MSDATIELEVWVQVDGVYQPGPKRVVRVEDIEWFEVED